MKTLKKKEEEYKNIRDYSRSIVKKLYPRTNKQMQKMLSDEITWGLCYKYSRGYKVSASTLGASIARNKLRESIKRSGQDFDFLLKIIDVIDRTNQKLEYVRKPKNDEEE